MNNSDKNAEPACNCSFMHATAYLDVMNNRYLDAVIQDYYHCENETAAAVDIVRNLSDRHPVIITCDRSFENYNLFANIEERLFAYVIRVKDSESSCMVSGMGLPSDGTYDITKHVVITRHSTGPYMVIPHKYKNIGRRRFDPIPDLKSPDYEMTIRFVRIELDNGNYEVLATNLESDKFPAEKLKEIYNLRWGIETSFRTLKKALGACAYHSSKSDSVKQELLAHMIMYNVSLEIISGIELKTPTKTRKYNYAINITQAVKLCLIYFRYREKAPLFDIAALIQSYILPVRPGRKNRRNMKTQGAIQFNYRLT